MNDRDMNGWNQEQIPNLVAALEDANQLLYELNNCIRGCYSGAHTYEELKEYAERIADRIKTGAEDCEYVSEEEDEEDW